MKVSTIRNKLPKAVLIVISILFWAGIWYLGALAIDNLWLLPYPHTVLITVIKLIITKAFWKAILTTMLTVVGGCVIGCVVGCILAIGSSVSQIGAYIIKPFVTVLRATPIASIIILIYVIVRKVELPITAVSLLIVIIMVIPVLYGNLVSGIASFDKDLAEVSKVFCFPLRKKIFVLWLPQAYPHIMSGVITSLGFAWKAGVAAEVICNLSNTVGQHLYDAKVSIDMDVVMAWTSVVVLLSMLFEVLFKKAFKQELGGGGKKA